MPSLVEVPARKVRFQLESNVVLLRTLQGSRFESRALSKLGSSFRHRPTPGRATSPPRAPTKSSCCDGIEFEPSAQSPWCRGRTRFAHLKPNSLKGCVLPRIRCNTLACFRHAGYTCSCCVQPAPPPPYRGSTPARACCGGGTRLGPRRRRAVGVQVGS